MARSRSTVTKRKPRRKSKKTTPPKRQRSVPPLAMNVSEFCRAHTISRDFFYELLKLGLGPDCMMLKKRRLISFEASERWRAEHEAAEAAKRERSNATEAAPA